MAKYLKLKQLLAKIINTPLVVERGNEGIWTWRKWTDGTAECWGHISETFAPTNAWGSTKYVGLGERLLPEIFIDTPVITATCSKTSGNGIPIVTLERISATSFYGFIDELSTTNYTYPLIISFYAVGQWGEIDPNTQEMVAISYSQDQMTKAEIQALIEASGNQFKDNDTWVPSNLT